VPKVDKQSKFNRIDNLKGKGWKPGQSGNPKGRPKKGEAWADVANELLDSNEINITMKLANGEVKHLNLEADKSLRHAVIIGQIKEAMKGNVQAAKELADRTEGRSRERREVSFKTEPIKILTID
jgi:hypothetical protein